MDFYSISQWIYPLLDLIVMILCFSLLRNTGGILLGAGFLTLFISSLSWPVTEILVRRLSESETDFFYDLNNYIAFGAYFVAAVLFMFGVVILSATLRTDNSVGQPLVQTSNGDPYQTPASHIEISDVSNVNGFGNILLYLIPYLAGIGVMVVGFIIMLDSYNLDVAIFIILLAALLIVAGSIYLLVIIYRLWTFIIAESNRLGLSPAIRTPARAVGFLFIPLFNFYWIFLVFGKMAVNINAIARHRGATLLMPEGLGNTMPILIVLTIIPYLGSLISLILGVVLVPIFISQAMRMSTSLSQFSQTETT